jgi:hypothetical protein
LGNLTNYFNRATKANDALRTVKVRHREALNLSMAAVEGLPRRGIGMMQPVFFKCGINEAGTTLVIKPVEPKRRNPFAPEFFLCAWDRMGFDEASATLGELLLRLLKVHYPAAFQAVSLTPPQARLVDARAAKVVSIEPFDWHGAMRQDCLAVGVNYCYDALRIGPFSGDKRSGMGESVSLESLDGFGHHQAWQLVGALVLGLLATMHPDAFARYPDLVAACGKAG